MQKEKKRICPECKGIIKSGRTEMVYELENMKITIKNVTANICGKCGQSFVSGRVAEEVNRMVNRVSEDINSFVKTQPEVSRGHRKVAIAV
ncbi:MAG: YgiT-type zinc finger protein [Nitrospirae bacterium]|nr:MAG: YgiT-type zinc finger protein [Nitrospirota bacterium]